MRLFLFCLLMIPTIGYTQVSSSKIQYLDQSKKLQGTLYWSPAYKEKRPGIVLYPEWWGLANYPHDRARKLAELGYVVLAADMYGKGYVTKSSKKAQRWMEKVTRDPFNWVQRASAALDQLLGSSLVDPDNIAVIGYGFGGGTALQMSYAGYNIKGAVSIYGSLPLAPDESKGKVNAKILLFHGSEVSSITAESVSAFKQQLNAVDAKWKLVTYQGVKSGFSNPDSPKYDLESMDYNEAADHDSWKRIKEFLAKTFAKPASSELPSENGVDSTSEKLVKNN